MNVRKRLAAALILILLSGCNVPTAPPAEPTLPPLDQTITALYKTAEAEPATITPGPQVVTATVTVPAATATITTAARTNTPQATNTPPPTNTFVPPTAAPPSRRGGLSIEAVHWSGTGPTIDGDWSEWKSVAREYPATSVVYGAGNWANEDDLAGSFYVGWDATYLYVASKVRDDKYVQNATGQNIFKGDSLEMLIDTNLLGDFYSNQLSGDDYQIGISPGRPTIRDGNAEAYVWFPSGKAGTPSGVKIAAIDEGTVYRVEAAIPWSILGLTPQSGMRFGFAFSISDCDTPGATVQESMVSSAPGRHLTNPTTWHDLVLK